MTISTCHYIYSNPSISIQIETKKKTIVVIANSKAPTRTNCVRILPLFVQKSKTEMKTTTTKSKTQKHIVNKLRSLQENSSGYFAPKYSAPRYIAAEFSTIFTT